MKTRHQRDGGYVEGEEEVPKSAKCSAKTLTSKALSRNWNCEENIQYVEFLRENKRSFED